MKLRVGAFIGASLVAMLVAVPVAAHVNDVRADPQLSPDGTIVAETAFIAADGWLVLHADDDGEPGTVVGYTRLSGEDGFQADVPVTVDDDVWDKQTGPTRLWVALHGDRGGSGFNPDDDPLIESFGRPVADQFALGKGDRALVTARRFAPQKVSEAEVTVRRAALPTDGYLVLHNASDGRLVGVRSLKAGSHTNITVRLNETFFESRPQSRLNATLYVETGNDGFDEADKPIRVAGDPVRTTFGFRNTAYTAGSPTAAKTGTTTASASATTGSPTEESVVVTASPTPSESATPTDTGQSGFGLAGAVVALAAIVLAARGRP